MIKGIGIDMVTISEMRDYIERFGNVFTNRTFTKNEAALSVLASDPSEYLATRFAVKEAVFKAIAHYTSKKGFDFRIVETLNEKDGYPFVQVNDKMQTLLDEAGVSKLHISISTENDLATAFIVAESS